jgi:anti-sigma factor RsiW
MSEHLSTQLMERYCQRKISGMDLATIDEHLTGCAECRQRLSERKRLDATYQALLNDLRAAVSEKEEDHLSDEQLSAYIAGELAVDEHRSAEAHLKACSSCAWQAGELREYAATIPPYKTYQPPLSAWEKLQARWQRSENAQAAEPVFKERESIDFSLAPASAPGPSSAQRPPARRGFSFRLLMASAAALASIVLVATIAWQLLKSEQPTEVAQQPTPTTPQPIVTPRPTLGATPETSPQPTQTRSSPVFAVFLSSLARGSEKAEKFEIRLQPDAAEAQIRIDQLADADPSGNKFESYTATLETNDGRIIWRQARLRARAGPSGNSVTVRIPASKLNNGEYILSLYGITAEGDEKRVGDCKLNVTKPK